MKRILLLSSLYPSDDVHFKNNTAVCHYFAVDWMKQGYQVRVINLYHEYPLYFYPILKLAKNFLANKVSTAILAERKHQEHTYELNGIKITRLPVYKNKPHGDFSDKVIKNVSERIFEITEEEGFVPDFIVGHFLLPGIRIVAALKDKYPNAVSTISLHGKETVVKESVAGSLPKIDFVGYRSYPIKDSFEKTYGVKPSFMCMSGVPADYIVDEARSFEKGVHSYIYVGNFMKRKYPSLLVPAIARNYPNGDYHITFVGDGNGIHDINKKIAQYGAEKHVKFTGRIPRPDVTKCMDSADVFIMISENETFGLVWLEAMSRGCIAIASRDEGMDGVIINGVNGFLCKAGDENELERIISDIKKMDATELHQISQKAIETAKNMTDRKMAEAYINGINC